jgi:hypothetical protein
VRPLVIIESQIASAADVLLAVGGEAYARDLIERPRRRGYLPEP